MLQMVRQTLFRETIRISLGKHCNGVFAVRERDWVQLQIQQEKVGIYIQGAGWRLVVRKFLRRSISDKDGGGVSG